MVPVNEMAQPVNADDKLSSIHFTFNVSTPEASACSSPNVKRSSSLVYFIVIIDITKAMGANIKT